MQETWEDPGSIPGSERSPGGGKNNLLQYPGLENPMDMGPVAGYSPWGQKESDTTERLSTQHLARKRRKAVQVRGMEIFKSHNISGFQSEHKCPRLQGRKFPEFESPALPLHQPHPSWAPYSLSTDVAFAGCWGSHLTILLLSSSVDSGLPRWLSGLSMRETWVWSLGWEDLLEKEMAAHSSILAWKIPWTEEPSRLQSMGSQKSQTRLSD